MLIKGSKCELLIRLYIKNKMKSFAKWYPVIAMIAIDLAFAISNILLKKIVSEGIDRLVFITYRQSISAIFLSPIAFFLERFEFCTLFGCVLLLLEFVPVENRSNYSVCTITKVNIMPLLLDFLFLVGRGTKGYCL